MNRNSFLEIDSETIAFSLYDEMYRGQLFIARQVGQKWVFLRENQIPFITNKQGNYILDKDSKKIITLGHYDFSTKEIGDDKMITPLLVGKIADSVIEHQNKIELEGMLNLHSDTTFMNVYEQYNVIW